MSYLQVNKKNYLSKLSAENKPIYYKDFKPVKNPSFWDVTKWPEYWEKGAQQLEKTDPGKIITAPVRIMASATGATKKTLDETPNFLKGISKTIPLLAFTAIIIGGVYVASKSGLLTLAKNKIQKLSPNH